MQKFRAFLLVLGLHMLMCLKQAYDGENGFQKHGCQVLYNQLVIRVNSEKTSSRFTPPQVKTVSKHTVFITTAPQCEGHSSQLLSRALYGVTLGYKPNTLYNHCALLVESIKALLDLKRYRHFMGGQSPPTTTLGALGPNMALYGLNRALIEP